MSYVLIQRTRKSSVDMAYGVEVSNKTNLHVVIHQTVSELRYKVLTAVNMTTLST